MAVEYNGPERFIEAMACGVDDEYSQSIDGNTCLYVKFQTGGTAATQLNGVFVEDLIIIAAAKLNEYNKELPDRRNTIALTHLEEAISALHMQKTEREYRGVYGTEEK